ncbi:MAG: thioesterase [Alphaproteobacteria bacterium]|nr:hypothetical protein [Hyphomonas sp.]MBR9808786.1 thioesterase [Alphaproteobacteria bacterium]|tara:strand:+ start:3614 stop:4159 length:546 start_codon:yes stop_codon:yes gene_type:complete
MNLFFRFLRVFLPAFFSSQRTNLLDVHIVKSAVWLGDQDPMGHMTNSRYSSFTDLGIMNFMGRTGTLKAFRKRGWMPVIQHESLTFYRMMRFPQKFELRTQMVGWEDCYICFRHEFHSKGKLIAESRMVARLTGRRKTKVTAEMALEALGLSVESPQLGQRYLDAIADLQAKAAERAAEKA